MPYTMPELINIIETNVERYLNDVFEPNNGNNNVIRDPLGNPFPGNQNQSFIYALERQFERVRGAFDNNKESYKALIDERGFEFSPDVYKKDIFKRCSYIDFAFNNHNHAIMYPYNNIHPDALVEKMKNIKSFIDANIQKQETEPEEAIKDLPKLFSEPDYIYSIRDAYGMENKHLLGTRFKSFLLYHTHPEYYPEMTTKNLFALYMLTAGQNRIPDPRNCDFVTYTVNGGVNAIDINKNYPYEKFVTLASSIYNKLNNMLSARRPELANNSAHKFILVEAFLFLVYEYNSNYLNTVNNNRF